MSGVISNNIFVNVNGNLGFNFDLPNNPEDWTSTATNITNHIFTSWYLHNHTLYWF